MQIMDVVVCLDISGGIVAINMKFSIAVPLSLQRSGLNMDLCIILRESKYRCFGRKIKVLI